MTDMKLQEQYQQHPLQYSQPPADDEIDLRELFLVIWRGKWVIVTSTLILAIAAVIFAMKQPNIYQASALLAPSSQESSKLNGMASQLGGLASLAGINLGGGGGTDQTTLAIEVIKSRQFFSEFAAKYKIKPQLMAPLSWDMISGKLSFDPELYDAEKELWVREVEAPKKPEPSDLESHKVFIEEVLGINTDKETGLISISVEHISPLVAQQWVSWIVNDINRVMKQRAKQETLRNINYLKKELEKTSLSQMQTVFYQLIEEQTKSLMLAEANSDFIFKVIDPAVVAEQKVKPKRALICVLGTLLGGMLGVMIVLIGYFAKSREQ